MAKKNHYPLPLSCPDRPKGAKNDAAATQLLAELQIQLLTIQQAYINQGRRAVLVLEGPDTAGKGGIIRTLVRRLDMRHARVWPIGAPSEEESEHHYLYRFWRRMPEHGTFAIFDRSWYGRVLVERIEGFCSEDAWRRAYGEINAFEQMLHDDGVRIVKLLPVITYDEQAGRFKKRIMTPHKRWKFTADDMRNRGRWDEYIDAFADMLDKTSTDGAPWHVLPGNKKWYARIQALQIVVDALEKGVDVSEPSLDEPLFQSALKALEAE